MADHLASGATGLAVRQHFRIYCSGGRWSVDLQMCLGAFREGSRCSVGGLDWVLSVAVVRWGPGAGAAAWVPWFREWPNEGARSSASFRWLRNCLRWGEGIKGVADGSRTG